MSDHVTEWEAKTLPVPEAGRRYFGLGRNASYAAAKRGDIPTIQIGRLLRAPVVALERRKRRNTRQVQSVKPIDDGLPGEPDTPYGAIRAIVLTPSPHHEGAHRGEARPK